MALLATNSSDTFSLKFILNLSLSSFKGYHPDPMCWDLIVFSCFTAFKILWTMILCPLSLCRSPPPRIPHREWGHTLLSLSSSFFSHSKSL